MRAIQVLFLCCAIMCILGMLQGTTCKTKDPITNPTPCTQTFGTLGCIVCMVSLYYIFFAKVNK